MKKSAEHFQRIGLVGNAEKPAAAASVRAAAQLIRRAGRIVFCDAITARHARIKTGVLPDTAALARAVDLLIIFGGDGTMLHTARQIAGYSTPVLGVNIGGLGFLTAVPSDQLAAALKLLWQGEFRFESRALIAASGNGNGRKIKAAALNDIVVSRGAASRLIALDVSVNGELVTRYRCDGLIVSSPTGSTAYSLAAGGPILGPETDSILLTPICPHTLTNRALVVGTDQTIRIRVIRQEGVPAPAVQFDGRPGGNLRTHDWLEIRPGKTKIQLAYLPHSDFYHVLRQKLKWSGASV
ncbi:MAG TPA: NAD(+)/NADH kinase [Verrucomicrobiae bacterium]